MANLLLLGTALFIAFLLGYILRCVFCNRRNQIGGFSGKRLWVLLFAIFWGLLSLWWYACNIKNMCEVSATAVSSQAESSAPAPISFAWSSSAPVTTAGFQSVKTKIVAELPDGKMLHIVGQYYNGEDNPSEYADIGVARAVETAKFFVGLVDEARILVSAENLGDFSGDKSGMFPAVKIGYADLPEDSSANGSPAPTLAFAWSSSNPQVGAGFDAVKAKLIDGMGQDNALRIVGQYYAGEENDSSYDNLGLARAAKVRELFIADADKNRVLIAGELAKGDNANHPDVAFEAVKIDIIPLDAAGFKVKEEGGRRIVYFPFDSHDGGVDSNLENYLADLARELSATGKAILIVGHTDNAGNSGYNHRLGWKRAQMVKDLLIKHGVEQRSIGTDSKGEDEPVADNSTEKGRAENRRVELFIQ